MKTKSLEEIKVKTNMEFVYFDREEKMAIRIDCFGDETARHSTCGESTLMFFIDWLAIERENENKEFIFLKDKNDLQKINFRK